MALRNAVVWLTGASSGIGEALVAPLVARGARVAISARRADLLDAQAARWQAQGADVRAYPLDVTDRPGTRAVVERVLQDFGQIDVAVLNAGNHATPKMRPFDGQQYVDNMTLNFFGMIYGIEAVLPGMLARGEGYLLSTASAAGLLTNIGDAPYSVTKHAAVALAEWLSITYGDDGIRVSCLCPQGVNTDMLREASQSSAGGVVLTQGLLEPGDVADAVSSGCSIPRSPAKPQHDHASGTTTSSATTSATRRSDGSRPSWADEHVGCSARVGTSGVTAPRRGSSSRSANATASSTRASTPASASRWRKPSVQLDASVTIVSCPSRDAAVTAAATRRAMTSRD